SEKPSPVGRTRLRIGIGWAQPATRGHRGASQVHGASTNDAQLGGGTVTQSAPRADLTQVVRQEAGKFLGNVQNLSREALTAKVKGLAASPPDRARQLVDSVGNAIDRATGGKYAGQMDRLQQMAMDALGLKPGSIPSAGGGSGGKQSGRRPSM